MRLEPRALLIEGDGFLKRGLAGLELLDDRLETLEGVLEAELGGDASIVLWGVGHGGRP